MSGKKSGQGSGSGVESSFFGDDDWLDDEEDAASPAEVKVATPEPAPPRMPVAPPPEHVPTAQIGRFGPAAGPSNLPRKAPMQTLPPMFAAELDEASPDNTAEKPVLRVAVPADAGDGAVAEVPELDSAALPTMIATESPFAVPVPAAAPIDPAPSVEDPSPAVVSVAAELVPEDETEFVERVPAPVGAWAEAESSSTQPEPQAEPEPLPSPVVVAALPLSALPQVSLRATGDDGDWDSILSDLDAEAQDVPALRREAARIAYRLAGSADAAWDRLRPATQEGGSPAWERAAVGLALGRWSDAASDLTAFAETSTGATAAEAWREVAAIHLELGASDLAERALRRATEADPSDFAAWMQLRDIAVARGDGDAAIAAVEKLVQLAGRDGLAVEYLFELGVRRQQQGAADAAREAYRRALEIDPLHMRSFVALDAITGDSDERGRAIEAVAVATPVGPDRAWAWNGAGRVHRRGGNIVRARASLEAAVAAGSSLALRELDALLATSGTADEQTGFLRGYLEQCSGAEKAFALYRLGRLLESAGDAAGAAAAFAEVRVLDTNAEAAAYRAEWLAESSGGEAQRRAVAARAERETGDARIASLTHLGRLAERDGALDEANAAYSGALSLDPAHAPAIEGMERVLRQTGAWLKLAEFYAHRAGTATDAAEAERRLFQAATAGEAAGSAASRRDWLMRALDRNPDSHLLLSAALAVLEDLGEWNVARTVLERAAETTFNPVARSEWLERAARIALDRMGDTAGASALVAAARAAEPSSRPAAMLIAELSNVEERSREVRQALALANAEQRAWLGLLLAELSADSSGQLLAGLAALLGEMPESALVAFAYEQAALREGAKDHVRAAHQWAARHVEGSAQAERLARAAALAAELGDTATAVTEMFDLLERHPGAVPLRGLAHAAERVGAWLAVTEILGRSSFVGDQLHRARVLMERLHDDAAAAEAFAALLEPAASEVGPRTARIALGAVHAGRRGSDEALELRGMVLLAELADSSVARVAYAAAAGALLDRRGDGASAPYWELVLAANGSSRRAFEQAVRALVQRKDAAGLQALYSRLRAADALGLGDALEQAGDRIAATTEWTRAATSGTPVEKIAAWARLERARSLDGDWAGVYAAVNARRGLSANEGSRGLLDAKRRWLLLEKLSETDEAWTLFQELHAQRPVDRDVTEALARIAGARGETALAVQYLKTLSEGASSVEDAARYQRRVAEAYERAGDVASARQALLDALDHVPNDRDTLGALRGLAERGADWSGLASLIQRQISLSDGLARVELRRELASLTEIQLGQPRVAVDAWRAVLDEAPGDETALERLVELTASVSDWPAFVEAGTRLAERRTGAERTGLLRRVGVACQSSLDAADAIRYFERAITEGPVDVEAARALAALHAKRADWSGSIRAMLAEASVTADSRKRAALLANAAKTELDMRQDSAAASRLYAEVLEADPEHDAAVRFQVERLTSREGGEAAIPTFERLEPYVLRDLDLDDFDARLDASIFFFRFAEGLRAAGRRGEALLRYERALELNPTHLPSLEAAGPLYVDSKQWEPANKVYRQILQLTGGHGEGLRVAHMYTQLGVIERSLGSDDKAQKRFSKALEVQPNYAPALRGMADVAEGRRDWSGCLNHYNSMITNAVAPEDVLAGYIGKGRILDQHLERPDKAAAHYLGCFEIEPDYPSALLRLAELSIRQSAWEEAENLAARGLMNASVQGAVRANLALARAAAAAGRGAKADVALALGIARPSDPSLALSGDESAAALHALLRGRLPTA